MTPATRTTAAVAAGVGWLASVVLLDGVTSTAVDLWLRVSGWLLLAALGALASPDRRLQVGVVVLFAAAVEVVFAGWLGAYSYRRGPVAPYVIPGHGVLFLTAVAAASLIPARAHRGMVAVTGAAAVVLGVIGLVGARPDQLGAFWAVCMLGFLTWRRYAVLFAVLFWLALALEYAGVSAGAWSWAATDPVLGWVGIGDPPSVPGGGYCFFAAAGLVAVRWFRRSGHGSVHGARPHAGHDGGVGVEPGDLAEPGQLGVDVVAPAERRAGVDITDGVGR